jgi:hypothetical protein
VAARHNAIACISMSASQEAQSLHPRLGLGSPFLADERAVTPSWGVKKASLGGVPLSEADHCRRIQHWLVQDAEPSACERGMGGSSGPWIRSFLCPPKGRDPLCRAGSKAP